jgi:hypothetical protein
VTDPPWWTAQDVAAWLASQGSPWRADSFRRAAAQGRAPAPGAYQAGAVRVPPGTPGLPRSARPLWEPGKVKAWHAKRRGHGWRKTKTHTEEQG